MTNEMMAGIFFTKRITRAWQVLLDLFLAVTKLLNFKISRL